MRVFVSIGLVALVTYIIRYIPFLIFQKGEVPKDIIKLGEDLPPAIMILLVIYCVKNVNLFAGSRGIPEFISIVVVIFLHYYKRNILLSILVGTALYMYLVQAIFI